MRTLEELAEAAVDATQTEPRVLEIWPAEYATLAGARDAWDPIVGRLAAERGLDVPLPDVTLVVVPADHGIRGMRPAAVWIDEAVIGWEALEQHAREQGWDDE